MIDTLAIDFTPSMFEPAPTTIYALLLPMRPDGQMLEGGRARAICETAANVAPEVWIMRSENGGLLPGTAVQAVSATLVTDEMRAVATDPKTNPFLEAQGAPPILYITAFGAGGVNAARRAQSHAAQSEEEKKVTFHALMGLTVPTLLFALEMDARTSEIDAAEHKKNVDDARALAATGSSDLATEIQGFLDTMENPYDIKNRYNVYRLVLVARAIIRRAKLIAEGKEQNLVTIDVRKARLSEYIMNIVCLAAHVDSLLADPKKWWYGPADSLNARNKKLRENFVKRMREYAEMLNLIHASPYNGWAQRAAKLIRELIDRMNGNGEQNIIRDLTQQTRINLQAMVLAHKVSTSIHQMREPTDEHRETTNLALDALNEWTLSAFAATRIMSRRQRDALTRKIARAKSAKNGVNLLKQLRVLEGELQKLGGMGR